jgi:hypothetical protein
MDTNGGEEVTKPRLPWSMLRALVALIALVLVVVVVVCRPALRERDRANCAGLHMTPILFAIAEYSHAHGSLPPAYISDKKGRPMHSWRVLILPYLGYGNLYERYNFKEPWDSPSNHLLAKEMPREYRCPASSGQSDTATNYVAVIGSSTPWPGERAVRNDEFEVDETATPLLVEIAESDIDWMSPRDMAFEQAIKGVNVDPSGGISSNHPGGAYVGFIDGFVSFLYDDVVGDDLRRLLTLRGMNTGHH